MPRKPRKILRVKRQLTDIECAYLTDDFTVKEGYELWCYRHGRAPWDEDPVEIWETNKAEFLPAFIKDHPGIRPIPWWLYDAPRWADQGSGAWYEGTLPEPRQRFGGIGTPSYEVLSIVPSFYKGIPTSWVSKFDEEYYNGRRKDIHGNIIPTSCKDGDFRGVAIDESDPPVFESSASYLLRHNLLTDSEKKILEKTPEAFKPESIIYEKEL